MASPRPTARIAPTRSASGVSLTTYPRAPARSARNTASAADWPDPRTIGGLLDDQARGEQLLDRPHEFRLVLSGQHLEQLDVEALAGHRRQRQGVSRGSAQPSRA